uniref:Uncharacterized protein n=1 Tax=Panagrolaimus superbus TaxID=310955 RepID=A0A914XV36_9BILA
MIYSYNKGYPEDVIKGYFWFLHCYTILIFIITGIYICYSLGKYENSKEKANPKIKVIAQDIFPADPFTQKCMY